MHILRTISYTFVTYYPQITCYGNESKGNDHKLKKLLIVKQILLVSTLGNVWRAVRECAN